MDTSNMTAWRNYLESTGYAPGADQKVTYMTPEQQALEYERLHPYKDSGSSSGGDRIRMPWQMTADQWTEANPDAEAYWRVNSDLAGGQRGIFNYTDDGSGNMSMIGDPNIFAPSDIRKNALIGLAGVVGGGLIGNMAGLGGAASSGGAAAGSAAGSAAGTGVTVGGPMTFGNVAGAVTATDLGLLGGAAGVGGAAGGSAGAAGSAAASAGLPGLSGATGLGGASGALGTVGSFVKDNKDLIGLGVTAAGGLLGAAAGGDTTTASTSTRDPWAPAQPYLKDNLATNKTLQDYYAQNPFNDQQKQSYNNIFGDLNNFRSNTAPGLMNFANSAMSSGGYQRPQLSAPGQGGYGARPAQPAQQPGPFSVNQGNFTMPDWLNMNPFKGQ